MTMYDLQIVQTQNTHVCIIRYKSHPRETNNSFRHPRENSPEQVEIILITKYVPSFRYILRSKYRKCTFFSFCVLYILVDDSCRMVRTLFCQ